ncbi:MAG: carbamate kinase [Candidatus Micrarchaeia archaeon]
MLYVVSIGGNALDRDMVNLKYAIEAIKVLAKKGKIIITHGNGPQVGELARFEVLSLSLLTAQTEAEIGYIIKKSIKNNLGLDSEVLLTDILVDRKDNAFLNPTKPIGRYYEADELLKLKNKGFRFCKFERGYRRIVPSPLPIKILNFDTLKALLHNKIVIAGGGGGIPLTKTSKGYEFAEAVIDKDYTTALIANKLKANVMFILTNVDGAYLNYGMKEQTLIKNITAKEIKRYLADGEFEEGSMKPKVKACIEFVEKNKGIAVICNLNKASDAIKLRNCTVITP